MSYGGMMERQTILDTEFATLWYYPEERLIRHCFHKPVFDKNFQKVLNSGLKFFEDKKVDKWLSDDRKNSVLPAEDCAWSQDVWLPKMLRLGWKYWAIVMPENLRGQIVMERLIAYVAAYKVTAKTFSDPDEALAWLLAGSVNPTV